MTVPEDVAGLLRGSVEMLALLEVFDINRFCACLVCAMHHYWIHLHQTQSMLSRNLQ